jgi:hypothetical protein
MSATLRNRVKKLERFRRAEAECDGEPTLFLHARQTMQDFRAGCPPVLLVPPVSPDSERCPRCGVPHNMKIVELLVSTREEAKAALSLTAEDGKGP